MLIRLFLLSVLALKMGCLSRSGLLFALCLVGLTATEIHGKAIRSAAGTLNSTPKDFLDANDKFLSFRDLDEDKAKYRKALEELQAHPKYKEAKERNDRDAEERRKRVNKWMETHPGSTPKPSDTTKAKYEKVLEQLKGSPKYLEARRKFGGGAEERHMGAPRGHKRSHSESKEPLEEAHSHEGY